MEAVSAEMDAQESIFGAGLEEAAGEARRRDLRDRVVEHNVIVIAMYYTRITVARLASLLGLGEAEAEAHLSEMVVSKAVSAKIDRPKAVVTFTGGGGADDLLNGWAGNISKLLALVETSNHRLLKDLQAAKA